MKPRSYPVCCAVAHLFVLMAAACSAPDGAGGAPAGPEGDGGGAAVDTDGDGIPDEAEIALGSDPGTADTDSDGINDLDELGGRTPQDAPDCDGDGIPDILEHRSEDSDGDGVPDSADPADGPFCEGGLTPKISGDPEANCPVWVCPDPEGGDEQVDPAEGEGEGEAEGHEGVPMGEGAEGEGEGEGPECTKISDADLTCDGVDDDCDGLVDDDFPVELCGVGACQGTTACVEGESSCFGPDPAESDVTCDGVDDDCDGQVDQGYVPDASCGVGVCAGGATPSSCVDGIEAPCTPGPAAADDDRTCDGADDDCDGSLDEDFLEIRCGVGICAAIRRCEDGQQVCPAGAPLSADDATCDGVDDNCNAQPDEDYLPEPCGVGACATETTCDDGEVLCPNVDPAGLDEDCDGIDQDCDGDADEGYIGEACGVGACETLTVCEDARVVCPDVEHDDADADCDGVDDDCDGVPDEDYVGDVCGDGVCAAVTVCTDAQEVCPLGEPDGDDDDCDGVDDDCDGQADEHYSGDLCRVGACRTPELCVGAQVVCPDVPHDPTDTTCDGVDDDCDGNIDEDYLGDACGVGACATVTLCEDGEPVCPELQPADNDPVCDQIDDDCDGVNDEDFVGLGCGVGACSTTTVCVRGRVRCPAVDHPDTDVTCNGIDDDCDSLVDDEFREVDCSVGECNAQTECVEAVDGAPARVVCDLPEHPELDLACDGLDEDCDGNTDEDWVEIACGRPGVCAGVLRCIDGGTECQDEGEELGDDDNCDQVDDDCDGDVDEGYQGNACQAEAEGRVCSGTFQCVEGEVECVPDGGAEDLTCDGVDDDCDGDVDEDFPADGCAVGTCDGITVCDLGDVFCEQVVKDDDLTCDGCDDDNNGDVDDGFPDDTPCDVADSTCAGVLICPAGGEICVPLIRVDDATCDGCDDDGDQSVDEDYVGIECEQANGCTGTTVCTDGEAICSALNPDGNDATCDGCDDDGDGATDEDWDSSGNCVIDGCPGHTACSGGEIVCAEGRNGLADNDCDACDEDGDGQVNEHYTNAEECVAGDGCQGHWECQVQQEVCVSGGLADDDTCDDCDDDGDGLVDENYLGGEACVTDGNCAGETSCSEGEVLCIDDPDPTLIDDDCDGVDDDCDGEVDEDCVAGDRFGWITFSGSLHGSGCHYQDYDAQGWPADTNNDNWADCENCTVFSSCGGQEPHAEIFAFDTMADGDLIGIEFDGLPSLDNLGAEEVNLFIGDLSLVNDSQCTFDDARGSRQFAAEWSGGTGRIELAAGETLVTFENVTMAWFFESPGDCMFFGNNNDCEWVPQESQGKSLGLLTADVVPAPDSPVNLARDLGNRVVFQIGSLNPPGPFGHCTQPQGGPNVPCNGQGTQHPCVDDCPYEHTLELRLLAKDHGEHLPAAGLELPPYGNRSNQGISVLNSNADLNPFEGDEMWKLEQGGWFAMPSLLPADDVNLQFRYGLIYEEERQEFCFRQCFQGSCQANCPPCSDNPPDIALSDDHDNAEVVVSFNSCAVDPVVTTHDIKWCAHDFTPSVIDCVNERNYNDQCEYLFDGCNQFCGGTDSWSILWSDCLISHGTADGGAPELYLADRGPAGGCNFGDEVSITDMGGRAGYFLFQFKNGADPDEIMMVDDLKIIEP